MSASPVSEGRAPAATPPIWVMGLAAFCIGCGMRLLDPLLPMMAREFGVRLGEVAVLIGGFALAYCFGQFASGPLGDRFGKLRVAAFALALYAGTLLGASLAADLSTLLLWRVLSGLTSAAVVPLLMAYIGDTVAYAHRQATLGRFLTGMVLAQMLAGPLSGALAEAAGWRAAFLVLGLLCTTAMLIFMLRIGPALWRPPEGPRSRAGLGMFARLMARPAARLLMLGAALDGLLLFGGAFPFIASLLIERFHLSAAEAGLIAAGFGLGSLAYTRLAGRLIARLGEGGMVLCGGVGLCLVLVAMALSPVWWVVAVAQAVAGLLFFMLHGVLQARSTEALPEARGTAVAGFAMSLFFGQAIGAMIFGAVIVAAGFTAAFLLAALGVLALAVWLRARVIRPG
jgi:predicted MFS family arabinose efflux permease